MNYCRKEDTVIEAAAALGQTEVFEHPVVQELAEKYDRSAPQVVLKWEVERDIVPLPKSSSPDHVRANLELFDWKMDDAELERLDDADENQPVYDTPSRDRSRYTYGITE